MAFHQLESLDLLRNYSMGMAEKVTGNLELLRQVLQGK